MSGSARIKILLNFFVLLAANLSAEEVELHVRAQAESRGALVLLGDVADVRGVADERRQQWEKIELVPAPLASRTRLLHVRELRELLALQGVNVSELRFAGARTTRISSAKAKETPPAIAAPSAASPSLQLVVAARKLNRGDVIRDSDVAVIHSTPQSPRAATWAQQLDEVVGREILQPLEPDQPIDRRQLRRPLLVRRGEVVRVVARAAGVQVFTTARATEDGALGDLIVLQSLENREKYSAQVTGLQQTEVYASGILAAEATTVRTPEQQAFLRGKLK